MNEARRLRVVALLGRRAGLAVLEDSLLRNESINLVLVATHRRLPRAEDPERGERPEFTEYQRICTRAGVRLIEADSRALASNLPFLDELEPIDLLVSVGWRYVLTEAVLARPALGAINLHRGALPEFAGAEPVRRAIEAGKDSVTITAHEMVGEVDAGRLLAEVHLPIHRDGVTRPGPHAEVVKERLLPLYAPLLDVALAARVAGR